MRVDQYAKSQTAGSELITTNLVSFTLLLSAVVFLGAVCRFLKKCCARLSRKQKTEHDAIAFTPVRRISQLRKSYSVPRLSVQAEYSLVHQEEPPMDTEKVTVQPKLRTIKTEGLLRPRAPTDPGSSRMIIRQISAPASYTPRGLARGETSPLARKILTRDWSSHTDIQTTDLEPQLYKKELSLQKFQTSSKHTCGNLDTEVYFDVDALELKVKVNSILQLVHKHTDETNTYVSVKKIPEQKSHRTSIHMKAIDPVYNEEFIFHINPMDDVSSHVLIYGLNHVDKFSTSYLRGEACLPLFQIDLYSRRRMRIPFVQVKRSLFPTMPPVLRTGITGCILISLKYEPSMKSFVVNPICVKYIPRKRHVGYGKNIYIKSDLRHKGHRVTKMKTEVIEMERMSENNEFYEAKINQPLTLEYRSALAEDTEIHVSLNHYLFLKSSFIIGEVRMSRTELGYESTHFQNMIDYPGEETTVWYEMRGFTTATAMEEVRQ